MIEIVQSCISVPVYFKTEQCYILIFFSFSDLKRKFERNPHPVKIELEKMTVLSCLPPTGRPLPEVLYRALDKGRFAGSKCLV